MASDPDIPPPLRRDRGVYIAREAMTHTNANEPEQAADAGMRALAIAQITYSGRITTELRRLDTALRRWKTVPRASEFRDAFGGAILHETRTRGRERGRRPCTEGRLRNGGTTPICSLELRDVR